MTAFRAFGRTKRGSAELEFEIPAICNSSREHAGSLWLSKARYRLEALLDASGCHEIESLIPPAFDPRTDPLEGKKRAKIEIGARFANAVCVICFMRSVAIFMPVFS